MVDADDIVIEALLDDVLDEGMLEESVHRGVAFGPGREPGRPDCGRRA
jgi:hypothetical protein